MKKVVSVKVEKYVIIEVGQPTRHFPLFQAGKKRNTIDVTTRENFEDGSFLNHGGVFTVYESEIGEYVDFTQTRFASYFGKIFVRDLENYLR